MAQLVERIWQPTTTYGRSRRDSRPFRYQAYVPDRISQLDPALPASTGAKIEAAARAAIELDSAPGVDDLEPVARLLLRAESVASSRIEGLRVSHRRLEEALFTPAAARGAAMSVVRNIEAMAQAVELGTRRDPLRVEDICAIQKTLMNTERDRHIAGVIRDEQNWLGGGTTPRRAEFIPPPPEFVPDLMQDLVDFANRSDLSAVLQAAIAHAQFETIHPFADGNGRTGRCLIHVILRRRDLSRRVVPPVSVVLAANASEYVAGLTAYRADGLSDWCSIFADAMKIAGERAQELGRSLAELREEWFSRAGSPRSGSTARRLIQGLAGHPLLSVSSAAGLLNVSEEAARVALNQLETHGVLKQVTIGRRNRAWAAEEVFDLLDEFDFKIAKVEGDSSSARPAPTRHLRNN